MAAYTTKVVEPKTKRGDFEPPRSSPGWDKTEWLEFWCGPGGKAWARRQAIKRLTGVKGGGQVLAIMRDHFYKLALEEWLNAIKPH